jgi:hypothetical protein
MVVVVKVWLLCIVRGVSQLGLLCANTWKRGGSLSASHITRRFYLHKT